LITKTGSGQTCKKENSLNKTSMVFRIQTQRAEIEAELARQLDSPGADRAVVESLMSRLEELLATPQLATPQQQQPFAPAVVGVGAGVGEDGDGRACEWVHRGAPRGVADLAAVLEAVVAWGAAATAAVALDGGGGGGEAGGVEQQHLEQQHQHDEPEQQQEAEAERLLQGLAEGELGEGHPFMCPISLRLMRDPVITAAGTTYERYACVPPHNTKHKTQ
jgi:hypothetical protein